MRARHSQWNRLADRTKFAAMIGARRVAVSRARSELRRLGTVEVKGRRVYLRRVEDTLRKPLRLPLEGLQPVPVGQRGVHSNRLRAPKRFQDGWPACRGELRVDRDRHGAPPIGDDLRLGVLVSQQLAHAANCRPDLS